MILDFGLRFLFMLQFDEHYAIGGYSALLRKVSWDSGIMGFTWFKRLRYVELWKCLGNWEIPVHNQWSS